MSVHQDTGSNYCPQCGAELDQEQVVPVSEDLALQGRFDGAGGHVVVEGSLVKLYEHASGEGGD